MKLRYTSRARRHLIQIASYLAERDPQAADRVLNAIEGSIELLREYPLLGRKFRTPMIRELVVSRHPYVVVYRVEDQHGTISILGVFHAAQGERPI